MAPKFYRDHFKRLGAVFLNTVGYGIGAQYGRGINGRAKRLLARYELGIAQAMWVFEVKNFGPLSRGVRRPGGEPLPDGARGGRTGSWASSTRVSPPPPSTRLGEVHNPEDEVF